MLLACMHCRLLISSIKCSSGTVALNDIWWENSNVCATSLSENISCQKRFWKIHVCFFFLINFIAHYLDTAVFHLPTCSVTVNDMQTAVTHSVVRSYLAVLCFAVIEQPVHLRMDAWQLPPMGTFIQGVQYLICAWPVHFSIIKGALKPR